MPDLFHLCDAASEPQISICLLLLLSHINVAYWLLTFRHGDTLHTEYPNVFRRTMSAMQEQQQTAVWSDGFDESMTCADLNPFGGTTSLLFCIHHSFHFYVSNHGVFLCALNMQCLTRAQ